LKTQRPTIQLLGREKGEVVNDAKANGTPDTMFLQGTLKPSIPLSCQFRVGPAFPGTPAVDWRITGSEGEIRITCAGPWIQIGYPDMKLELEKDGKVEAWGLGELGEEDIDAIPHGNVSRVYRELREGRSTCSFEEAVELHKVLEEAWKANGY
jgi:predicted dehydrogenase